MFRENNEIPNGWPLGLGNMNSRIRVSESSQLPAPQQPRASRVRVLRSSSFSSFASSSNLDTESTASFFPDQSVSLGRLIGIRPIKKGILYCEEQRITMSADERSCFGISKGPRQNSKGLCVPLLHQVIERMGRRNSSRY
ncbi:hypothetical protein ACJIZ3_006339 [Penstemon smallii]|uniref:Uncharacterized protein n=1 Tax=Penstemon smallii TaxID=265156 RepID=A0ABD3S7G7_9LAMI